MSAKSAKGTKPCRRTDDEADGPGGLGVTVLREFLDSAKGTSRAVERMRNFAKASGLGVTVLREFLDSEEVADVRQQSTKSAPWRLW